MQAEGRTNLILGVIARYDIKPIMPFIISLKKTSFRGTVCLIALNVSWRTQTTLRRLGVEVVEVPNDDRLLIPFITVFRSRFYCDYLMEHRHRFHKVLLTDVSDVIFQRDPFDFEMNDELCCFLEDPRVKIASCPFNSRWISFKFSEQVLAKIGHHPISCAGTVMGTTKHVLKYLEMMKPYATHPLLPGIDQGVHNYLIWNGHLSAVRLFENEQGPVLTLGHKNPETILINDQGFVENSAGRVVHTLHQYNRHASLVSHIASIYSKFTPGMFPGKTEQSPEATGQLSV